MVDDNAASPPGWQLTVVACSIFLNVKIVSFDDDASAQVTGEQLEIKAGYTAGCALGPIGFAAYANAFGARGFSVSADAGLRAPVNQFLSGPGPALIDVRVDGDEKC